METPPHTLSDSEYARNFDDDGERIASLNPAACYYAELEAAINSALDWDILVDDCRRDVDVAIADVNAAVRRLCDAERARNRAQQILRSLTRGIV